MKRALLYIRQSRHKDHERTASPEVQEEACRALLAVRGCDIVVVFADLDVSGGKADGRVGYQALLKCVTAAQTAGEVAVVAVYDQSRAFRNTTDALQFYALLEKRPWIEVGFVHGHFDRSPAGEFTYTAMAAAHAMERRMTAEKIRAAYRYRNSLGAATGMPPYGYRQGSNGQFEVNDEEAAVVRQLFADYASGEWSSRKLAARLNAEGVVKSRSRSKGLGWMPDTVVDILQNVAYLGKTYSVSRARREGDLIRADWSAIVSSDVFEAARRQMSHLRVKGPGPARVKEYVFGNLIVCARCGRRMRSKTNYSACYYYCRDDVAEDRQCGTKAIREEWLLPWADHLFERVHASAPANFREEVDRAGPTTWRRSPSAVAQLDRSLERLRKLFSWEHISEEEYRREHDRLTELRAELVTAPSTSTPIKLDGILQAWRDGGAGARRRLLGALFDALIVEDGRIVEYLPRADRVAEVVDIIEKALDGAEVVRFPGPPVRRSGQRGVAVPKPMDWVYRLRIG